MQGDALSVYICCVNNFVMFSDCPITRNSAPDWKVPTTFIYGQDDWVDYQLAQQACKDMKIPYEIIRVPQVIFHSVNTDINRCFRMALTTYTSMPIYAGRAFRVYG
jgi:hypothetical protein